MLTLAGIAVTDACSCANSGIAAAAVAVVQTLDAGHCSCCENIQLC